MSRDKTFSRFAKFLDLGEIRGLLTTFDFREIYWWIYELNQDLKLLFRFDKLLKAICL